MTSMLKRGCLLLTSAAMLFALSGCGKDKDKKEVRTPDSSTEESSEVVTVDIHPGTFGEPFGTDEVEAKVDSVQLSTHTFEEYDQIIGILFYEMTITNNTEESISANFLSQSFAIQTDGIVHPGITLRGPRFIHCQFGEDAETFLDPIAPGETRHGYVAAEIPYDFETATFYYYPNADLADWSNAFSFENKREDIPVSSEPVTPYV